MPNLVYPITYYAFETNFIHNGTDF